MSFHNHRQFSSALEQLDQTVLPNLSRLLDGVLESAALARPGVDALTHADALRHNAIRLGLQRQPVLDRRQDLALVVGQCCHRQNLNLMSTKYSSSVGRLITSSPVSRSICAIVRAMSASSSDEITNHMLNACVRS